MPQKTFKIGESCKHGIIKVSREKESVNIKVQLLDYDTKKVMESKNFHFVDKFKIRMYLEDNTTSYHADKVMDYLYA